MPFAGPAEWIPNQYCVEGNALHLITVNTTMPVTGTGQVNIDSDLVEIKK